MGQSEVAVFPDSNRTHDLLEHQAGALSHELQKFATCIKYHTPEDFDSFGLSSMQDACHV